MEIHCRQVEKNHRHERHYILGNLTVHRQLWRIFNQVRGLVFGSRCSTEEIQSTTAFQGTGPNLLPDTPF